MAEILFIATFYLQLDLTLIAHSLHMAEILFIAAFYLQLDPILTARARNFPYFLGIHSADYFELNMHLRLHWMYSGIANMQWCISNSGSRKCASH